MLRVLKWVYIAVLFAATGIGVWMVRPLVAEEAARRASPLAVQVYSHPFISALKDTAIGGHTSSIGIDNFFSPDVLSDAVAAITARQAPPFAKGADRAAWSKEFSSDLMLSLNEHMGRKYRDSLQRLDVANEAKGLVLVRLENVSKAPVEEIRVEVSGGQMFMEGSPSAAKFRSLGTRALRFGALGAGEKSDLFVLTMEDLSPGSGGARVKVSAKDVASFPVVVHSLDTPARPSEKDLRWIVFGVVYLSLILAGLGTKAALTLAGMRPAPAVMEASPNAAPEPAPSPRVQPARTAVVAPPPPPPPPAEPRVWQRPKA